MGLLLLPCASSLSLSETAAAEHERGEDASAKTHESETGIHQDPEQGADLALVGALLLAPLLVPLFDV